MQGQDGLTIFGEEHEIGFPMAWKVTVRDFGRAFGDRNTMFDMQGGTAAPPAPPAAFCLGAGQIIPPGVVLVAGDLGGDEAVDGLRADEPLGVSAFEEAASLLRRPAFAQTAQNLFAQRSIAVQL